MRMISAAVNKKPGPDASLRKALADNVRLDLCHPPQVTEIVD
jgi:hypothetical protein